MGRAARSRALWSTTAAVLLAAASVAWRASGPPATASPAEAPAIVWREPVATSLDVSGMRIAVAASDGVLVALTVTGEGDASAGPTRVQTSTDGIGWADAAPLDGVALSDVVATGEGFVAAGTTVVEGTTTPAVATSPNGTDWSVVELDGGPFGGYARDVGVTPLGILVGGARERGDNARLPAAWLSTDGQSWQAIEPDAFDLGGITVYPVSGVSVHEVGSAGSAAVLVGQFGDEGGPFEMRSWSSTDGVTWTLMPGLGEVIVFTRGLASGPPGAVLVADSDDPTADYYASFAWHTADGGSWDDRVSLPGLPDSDEVVVSDVAFGDPGFVAVGDDRTDWEAGSDRRPSLWLSPDGRTWQQVPQDELAGPALGPDASADLVVHDDGSWYVFGWTKPDGESTPVLWRGEATGSATPTPTPTATPEPTTATAEPTATSSPDETASTPTAVPAGDEDQAGAGSWGPVAALAAVAAAVAVAVGVIVSRQRASQRPLHDPEKP